MADRYFTHEDVRKAFEELKSDPRTSGDESQRVNNLIADVTPKFGMAVILLGNGNPVEIATRALVLGAQLGIKLSGAQDRINPNQELSAEFNAQADAAAARQAARRATNVLGAKTLQSVQSVLDDASAVTDKSKWN